MRTRLRRLVVQANEFGDAATYFSTVVVAQLASLILLPIATRYLTPPVYGEYALALSVTGLVGIVGSAWVRNVAMRLYFDHVAEGRTRAFFVTAASLQAVTMTAMLLVGYGAVVATGQQLGSAVYVAAGASVLAGDFYSVVAMVLRAGQRSRAFGLAEWVSAVLRVGVTWAALFAGFRSPTAIFLCNTLTFAAAVAVVLPSLSALLTGPTTFESGMVRELVRLGLPNIPQSVSSWVMSLSDRVLVARYLGVGAVGMYSAAYSVADRAVSGLVSALLMASWPAILSVWTRHAVLTPAAIARWIGAYVLLTLGPSVLLVVQRDFVLRLLLSPEYAAAADVVPWVVGAAWLSGLATYLNRPLELHKRYGLLSTLALVSAGLNIVFNLLLIPRWGVTGAAAATTAAYAAWALLSRAFSARLLRVPIPWTLVAGACMATMLALLVSRPFLSPWLAIPVYVAVYLVLALAVWTRTSTAVLSEPEPPSAAEAGTY